MVISSRAYISGDLELSTGVKGAWPWLLHHNASFNIERKISKIIGMPKTFAQVALLPLAYTKGTDFKPTNRPLFCEIIHWKSWE